MKTSLRSRIRKTAVAFCSVLPALSGCSNTFDVLSSQRFKEAPFHTLFHKDEPIEVLRKSNIPDDRARAFLEIKEPKLNGGNDELQYEVLQLLATAATSDRQPRVRMCAIAALGNWQDARCGQILMVAYYNAATENPGEKQNNSSAIIQAGRRVHSLGPTSSFTPDNIIKIRMYALEALGKKRTTEGLALMTKLAETPTKREVKPVDFDLMSAATSVSGQDESDLRLAAIRAMANFKDDVTAAQILYRVMTTEHDVAIKGRCYESLQQITGKEFPPDSAEWTTLLKLPPPTPPASEMKPTPLPNAPTPAQPGSVPGNAPVQPGVTPLTVPPTPVPGAATAPGVTPLTVAPTPVRPGGLSPAPAVSPGR